MCINYIVDIHMAGVAQSSTANWWRECDLLLQFPRSFYSTIKIVTTNGVILTIDYNAAFCQWKNFIDAKTSRKTE